MFVSCTRRPVINQHVYFARNTDRLSIVRCAPVIERRTLYSTSYHHVSNMAATNTTTEAGDAPKNGVYEDRKIALVTGITGQVRVTRFFVWV